MDAPQREYQQYLANVERWSKRKAEIVGDATVPDSLAFCQARLKALDDVPGKLSTALDGRLSKAKEIYVAVQSLAALYRNLYKPVQDTIVQQELAKQGQFQLDFKVAIVDAGFEDGLFNVVSQQKKGSFCGVEEGRQILKTLNREDQLGFRGKRFRVCERYRGTPPSRLSPVQTPARQRE